MLVNWVVVDLNKGWAPAIRTNSGITGLRWMNQWYPSFMKPCELTHLPLVPHIYMRQWIGWALAQIMACRLFGAKPLSEPMLDYCQLDPKEHTSVKFQLKFEVFPFKNAFGNAVCQNAGHFVQERLVNSYDLIEMRVEMTKRLENHFKSFLYLALRAKYIAVLHFA